MAALIISMGPATRPRSVAPWEVRPPAPAPRASESAACSLSPAGAGPTPTPPTPLCPPSLPPRTGTPALTPTAGAVKMSVNSGKSKDEKKNALNNVMMNEINYALAYAKQERAIRVVIIAAEGDVFCAGADLNRKQEESNVPRLEGSDDISLSIRHYYIAH